MQNSLISIRKCRCLIGLCSWQSPDMLKVCIWSLLNSIDTNKDRIIVVLNDPDVESLRFLYENKISFIYNNENSGPLAIDLLKGYIENSEYFINSNDDMIFHSGFVEDLISIIDSYYPCTASCGLVENFFSGNPSVVVDSNITELSNSTLEYFFKNCKENKYQRDSLIYGYYHPIMCKSQDFLSVGGYSGNWDMNFLSGYGRDDMFPYMLWKNSGGKYKFITSDKSVVFHVSSYTNKKLSNDYRKNNHNQDKFANLTGMSLNDFRQRVVGVGAKI